jgi:hypothetical protein
MIFAGKPLAGGTFLDTIVPKAGGSVKETFSPGPGFLSTEFSSTVRVQISPSRA